MSVLVDAKYSYMQVADWSKGVQQSVRFDLCCFVKAKNMKEYGERTWRNCCPYFVKEED